MSLMHSSNPHCDMGSQAAADSSQYCLQWGQTNAWFGYCWAIHTQRHHHHWQEYHLYSHHTLAMGEKYQWYYSVANSHIVLFQIFLILLQCLAVTRVVLAHSIETVRSIFITIIVFTGILIVISTVQSRKSSSSAKVWNNCKTKIILIFPGWPNQTWRAVSGRTKARTEVDG